MGLLIDLMVASTEEAGELSRLPGFDARAKRCAIVRVPGLSIKKLIALKKVLCASSRASDFPLVWGGDEEEEWVHQVSDELTDMLAQSKDKQVKTLAKAWMNSSEEFATESWPNDAVETLFKKLQEMAHLAKQQAKPMLLRISL